MNIQNANLIFTNLGTVRKKTDTLVLHHTGVTVLQTVQQIHNFHKNTNGWAGIGYHYYVRKDGTVWQGRPDNLVGAHCPKVNSNSVAICFEGNFETETMTDKQKQAGKEIVSYVLKKYPTIITVVRHKDVASTACPGKNFPFDEIKKGVTVTVNKSEKTTSSEKPNNSIKVKVIINSLNIRKSASALSKKVGTITDKGTYTITEVKGTLGKSGSWGKLKSGAGWISLYSGYVKKV